MASDLLLPVPGGACALWLPPLKSEDKEKGVFNVVKQCTSCTSLVGYQVKQLDETLPLVSTGVSSMALWPA